MIGHLLSQLRKASPRAGLFLLLPPREHPANRIVLFGIANQALS